MEEILPIRKKKQVKHTDFNLISAGVLFGIALLIIGVATAIKTVADWGAEHQIVKQRMVDLQVRLPYRIEEIEAPQPVVEVIVPTPYSELSSTEQKIIDLWGYKDGVVAIAIFKCESGLNPEAVNWDSNDVGIAQINFPIWKDKIKEKFGYTLLDLFNVDKNLEVAHWIWDRADGKEGDGDGSFTPWTVFNNASFVGCIE
jgi:PII-like signaling protein